MAKVKIQGHASGTGILTVTAPNTDTDRTITLPDSTDTLAVNSDVTNKLPLAGGTLTGNVTVSASGADASRTLSLQGTNGSSEVYQFNLIADGGNSAAKFMIGSGGGAASEKLRIQSGGGISFNGDTAAANALDDYEEGTWTPVLGGVSTDPTSVTYPVRVGTYTKIGNMVHASFYLEITAHSGGVGDALIKGLPYVVSNYTGYDYAGGFAKSQIYSQGSYSGGRNTFTISARKNNSYLMFRQYGGTTSVGMTGWGLSQMTGNLYVGGVYTYPVF